jgi:hypothetical protein
VRRSAISLAREWTVIDIALAKDPYLRFALESSRAGGKGRQWKAVLYRETGRDIVARSRANTREKAVALLVADFQIGRDFRRT